MQQPRRGRKRQSREEEVTSRGGLGRDEVVRPMAQGASAEVMVAGVGCGRKKKKLQRREKGWKEKREKVTVAALPLVRSLVDGNMVVKLVVEVEVGADVAAASAGEGRKQKWWC